LGGGGHGQKAERWRGQVRRRRVKKRTKKETETFKMMKRGENKERKHGSLGEKIENWRGERKMKQGVGGLAGD